MRPFANPDVITVVIEPPSGKLRARKYDVGFVPGTLTDYGDPLDVVVITNEPLPVGCYVECRVLGAFEVKTDGERDDRLIVVPHAQHHAGLDESLADEIGAFLESAMKREGRAFELIRRVDRDLALDLVDEARG